MIQSNAKEEYLHAMRLGLREQKEADAAGKPTAPAVLDELFPEAKQASVQDLPVQVRDVDGISVDDPDKTNAGANQLIRTNAAERPDTDNGTAGGKELFLTFFP